MEYRILLGSNGTWEYNADHDSIGMNMSPKETKWLSDEELIQYTADVLSHEHIHRVLYNLFGWETCSLFDFVEHYCLQYPEIPVKIFLRNQLTGNTDAGCPYWIAVKKLGVDKVRAHKGISKVGIYRALWVTGNREVFKRTEFGEKIHQMYSEGKLK